MTLTPAGRVVLVLVTFAALLFLIGVAARVWAGQWPADRVVGVGVGVLLMPLIAAMAWRWEA